MVPISLWLAVILPGNKLLPFADIAAMPFKVALVVALTNGNIFRSVVLTTIVLIPTLLFGTWTAQVVTDAAMSVGLGKSIPAGMLISSQTGTTMPVSYVVYEAFTGNLMITVPILLIAFLVIWIFVEKKVMTRVKTTDNTTVEGS
jgi:PTS system galactitol-specific IIC component